MVENITTTGSHELQRVLSLVPQLPFKPVPSSRVILILQKFEILNFAWCQIMAIGSLISELFLFLL